MIVAEAEAKAPRDTRKPHAFGIAIETSLDLPVGSGASTGRATSLRLEEPGELEQAWRPSRAETVLERRARTGRLVISVQHEHDAGYFVYAPRVGRHLVSGDGSRIISARPRVAQWRWERPLFAQVLPLAATLQGLELLHASAVAWDGRTLAFAAPAGTGKTSVAAHLVAWGGVLVTDDVLALERADNEVAAHPGVATIAVSEEELDLMSAAGRARLGRRLGRMDKVVLEADVIDHPEVLGRLYFLDRPAAGPLCIEPIAADPVRVLANSFNVYVSTKQRIANQLELASALISTVKMFSVRIPTESTAADVAMAIADHADEA